MVMVNYSILVFDVMKWSSKKHSSGKVSRFSDDKVVRSSEPNAEVNIEINNDSEEFSEGIKNDFMSDENLQRRWDMLSDDEKDEIVNWLASEHDMSDKGHGDVNDLYKLRKHFTSGFSDKDREREERTFNEFIFERTHD